MIKRFLLILVLIFSLQPWTKADDISDFEIEGMSIGDSLLDYMSEEEIKENVTTVYPDKKFTISMYQETNEDYTAGVAITYKSEDNKYEIHGIQGRISFSNIENCYIKQDEIEKEISSMLPETKKKDWGILKLVLKGLATEGDTYKPITFDFNDGAIMIACYYYYNDPPHILKVSTFSNELKNYLKSDKKQ